MPNALKCCSTTLPVPGGPRSASGDRKSARLPGLLVVPLYDNLPNGTTPSPETWLVSLADERLAGGPW
ncbi:MAG: hypothetical protein FJZ01_15460 [Candidatus Sericytochromatia bacterium]|nr:hypothetical protein [Candidatus Tanganyikabacteria bacterium]